MTRSMQQLAGCVLILLSALTAIQAKSPRTSAKPAAAQGTSTKGSTSKGTTSKSATRQPANVESSDARVEAFRKAYEAEKSLNYEAAIKTLRALPQSSQDYILTVRLAWLYNLQKDYNNAQKQYEAASREYTGALEPRIGGLLPLVSLEKYADVERSAKAALRLDPDNYYSNLRLSFATRVLGKLPAAEKINQKMLILYPADPNFLIEQALTLGTQKRYEECRVYYQQVLLVSPDNTIANKALSIAQGTRAKDSVSEVFRKAYNLELELKYEEAVATLATVQPQKQVEYFLDVRLGWLYYMAGKFDESRKYYDKAVKFAPKAVEPLVGALLPLLALKKYDEAEQTAHKAIKLDPKNYFANMRLAYALRMQSKFAEAEKVSEPMVRLYPSDVTLLLEHALALTGQERFNDAKEFYRQVQLLSPENATATKALASTPGSGKDS